MGIMSLRDLARPLATQVRRLRTAVGYYSSVPPTILRWLASSRETTNFTYDISPLNREHLAHAVSIACAAPVDQVRSYIAETADILPRLRQIAAAHRRAGAGRIDPEAYFGRRLGWYATARVLRPRLIVETGVEQGLGSVVLCSALQRNAAEGARGRYVGTDINPQAGALLGEQWREYGTIAYGDSIETLRQLAGPIDLFINDSDHSAAYEAREYEAIRDKLSPHAIILGDNAHATDELMQFSRRESRQFLFFKEQPKDHWYPGAGIGFSFKTGQAAH